MLVYDRLNSGHSCHPLNVQLCSSRPAFPPTRVLFTLAGEVRRCVSNHVPPSLVVGVRVRSISVTKTQAKCRRDLLCFVVLCQDILCFFHVLLRCGVYREGMCGCMSFAKMTDPTISQGGSTFLPLLWSPKTRGHLRYTSGTVQKSPLSEDARRKRALKNAESNVDHTHDCARNWTAKWCGQWCRALHHTRMGSLMLVGR